MNIDINQLKNSDTFCLAPWIHAIIDPNGDVSPCCLSACGGQYRYGSLKEKSLQEIWNSEEIKSMRLDMLNGIKRPNCSSCYNDESIGHHSYRGLMNYSFDKHFDFVKETENDGTFERFNLVNWDFRLDNVCNFKCRMCGPHYSSAWDKEVSDHGLNKNQPTLLDFDKSSLWEELELLFPTVEHVYFAGGEPLIMDSHYKILDKLIQYKNFDVRISYNTNFSTLTYKNKHIFDYWEKFSDVIVNVSIDASDQRGEFIRHGLIWKNFIRNIEQFYQKFPHRKLNVGCAVQLLNSFHVIDLHKKLYEDKIISNLDDFKVAFLFEPSYLSVQCLPFEVKKQIIEKIKDHIFNYLKPLEANESILTYISYAKYLLSNSTIGELKNFVDEIQILDKIRNEDSRKIFPEFEESIWKPYLDS